MQALDEGPRPCEGELKWCIKAHDASSFFQYPLKFEGNVRGLLFSMRDITTRSVLLRLEATASEECNPTVGWWPHSDGLCHYDAFPIAPLIYCHRFPQ